MNFSWFGNWFHKPCRIEASELNLEIEQLEDFIDILEKQIIAQETEKERYYNNKYPKKDINYRGRPILDSSSNALIDVRNFIDEFDFNIKKIGLSIVQDNDDETALEGLEWMIKNFKYVGDKETAGMNEFWQFSYESLQTKKGDCEDGAILLHNILLAAGIPYWKLRLSAGWVQTGNKKGGHAYLTYYSEENDKWVILDWCYWPNLKAIIDRPDYKDEPKYLDIWFSWNKKFCYTKGLNEHASELLA